MKTNKRNIVATSLVLSMLLGIGSQETVEASEVKNAPVVKQSAYSFTAEQTNILNRINEIRLWSGLTAMQLNPFLNKSALNHANFLAINGENYGHTEKKGLRGFTGATVEDRVSAVGGSETLREYAAEVIQYINRKGTDPLEPFLNSAYHRALLLTRVQSEVGVGAYGSILALNFSNSEDKATENFGDVMYPYNGQKGVDVGFYGFETPNPIAKFGVKKTGFIISFSNYFGLDKLDFQLTDSSGASIPFYSEYSQEYDTWFFYPKYELAYGEKYKAVVMYVDPDTGKPTKKESMFETKQKPNVSLAKEEVNLAVNNKYVPSKMVRGSESYSHNYSPVVKNNIAYVPAVYTYERLHAIVKYDNKAKAYTFKSRTKTVVYKANTTTATVNGKTIKVTQKPIVVNGNLYVPLSFLNATMGVSSVYDSKTRTVKVTAKIEDALGYTSIVEAK
ncbi:hypothetical protein B1A98_19590 [Bacillus badius]|nr:hypothetical protein B1A98_19590 [Bacillus badius]TDV97910.1 copper amine oxidase-like protein [Bacillus badius]